MAFSSDDLQRIWQKGSADPNNDPAVWRKDACTAWMRYSDYGDRNSNYGWEVDHIDPNGGDYLSNLRPLHWANNVAKGDGRTVCAVGSSGTNNVRL